jgi:hypothetical protein
MKTKRWRWIRVLEYEGSREFIDHAIENRVVKGAMRLPSFRHAKLWGVIREGFMGEVAQEIDVPDSRVLIIVEGGIIRDIFTNLELNIIEVEFDKEVVDPEEEGFSRLESGNWVHIRSYWTRPLDTEGLQKEWAEYERIIEEG